MAEEKSKTGYTIYLYFWNRKKNEFREYLYTKSRTVC